MAPLRLAGGVRAAALWVWLLVWAGTGAGNFYEDVDVTWGDGRGKILDGGRLLTLSLDRASGAGFQSKSQYLFGRFDVQLRLVPGNSAGTVTSFYLSSEGAAHDEVDFEFLGNLTGDPYAVHTNIYTRGKGGREQQFYLWFDPTKGFHTYTILWNPRHVVFYVDGTPIREFRNEEAGGGGGGGVAFPEEQPMRVYGSLWNADDWATRGGRRVKTDWSKAPFVASYRDFGADDCRWSSGASSCGGGRNGTTPLALSRELDAAEQARLRWVRKNYMVYDYCADVKRFPAGGLPPECTTP